MIFKLTCQTMCCLTEVHIYNSESTQRTNAVPILMFATVRLFPVLFVHHSWGVVGTVLVQSQVARHTVRSIMGSAPMGDGAFLHGN